MSEKKEKLGSSFGWLNVTQFLGALNDNIFQLFIIFYLTDLAGAGRISSVTGIAGIVFVAPFLLFTPYAGKLADRFSKRDIIVTAKSAELAVMLLASLAFLGHSQFVLYGVLFLMCTQSAFFGPSKYGIIPELVKTEQLTRANSFLEALTYLAIVTGVVLASFVGAASGGRYILCIIFCVTLAFCGMLAAVRIKRTPSAGGDSSVSVLFIRDVWRTLGSIRQDKNLRLAVFASAYFMLLAGFVKMNLIPYGIQELKLDQVQSGWLFLPAALGVGIGSCWAGRLSGRTVEFGIVPLGAIGMALSSILIAVIKPHLYSSGVLILTTGIGAGLFIVPLHAFIQLKSPEKTRGQVLAASAFLGWIGVAVAGGLIWLFGLIWQDSAVKGFMIFGVLTVVLAAATVIILPDFLIRLIVVLLTRLIYRIRVTGAENLPTDTGVLLVCNHVTWVDSLLLSSATQRRIRFVMERKYYNSRWINWLCRLMKAMPISSDDPPKKIVHSLRSARRAMEEGYIVCIFAEGTLTRSGMLGDFKAGFERIVKGTDYSIVPAYLGGAWGSIFSYYHGRLVSALPKRLPLPVSIHFGEPMGPDSTAFGIRRKVAELSCDYFNRLKPGRKSLAEHFINCARKNRRRRCISDAGGRSLNYGATLISSIALGTQIRKITRGQPMVGILLPSSVAGALANLAITAIGKVPVNLNYTASCDARQHAIDQCGIRCIISSRKFIEKAKLAGDIPHLVFIEDIIKSITFADKLKVYLKARFTPAKILAGRSAFSADDPAAVIFSSGSTGLPKGVTLSHHNIISNIEAVKMVFKIYPDDNLCAVLPFFHSFGFTCGLWLPLLNSASAAYVPNPLDGKTVGQSARQNKSTILFGAPTFFSNYIRRAQPEDFENLRFVVAGAERLKPELADSFEAKFGIRPLEGYGATELSPLVSFNLYDVEAGGLTQTGNKPGTVGRPLPGIAVKTVDLDTGADLDAGQAGILMVKGPNVMLGYLGIPEETARAVKDQWYNTGDVVTIDSDGFITITDRLSRFSKIGGEMVPHLSIEQLCARALGTHEQVVAVTSVPDEKKGEELVVLYVASAVDVNTLWGIISGSDLPNICKPRRDNLIPVDSIPLLGSGKLDIMKLRRIALDAKDINPT